ncbi:hypothetical protein [Duganella sp. Root1480D1]|uniref:hypothetical protein n=1 Tax=Duganella sp. Root1480D1 TaxID=1736471 RepID=UPI00070A6E22|nr:hypothetical protein [Duganella sp. Root1480D1]KQZ30223.1 hypothetical protein ASD58_09320 [Duganella sp. Root1480D1]
MQKLNAELSRLYLAPSDGGTRSICLSFRKLAGDGEAGHWERLCTVANALQAELGLPAPAVSISGAGAFGLWLSLEQPVTAAQAQEFARLVCADACAEAEAGVVPGSLPPFLNQASGKWAAFIHPGMGVSFAGDEGLDIQPPEAGQVAMLEGLESIAPAQFAQALDQLRQSAGVVVPPAHGVPATRTAASDAADDLLLKDATLEDIVNFLHSKNIEPTFRFLK